MIFISYAKEDHSYAHELYNELNDARLEPWMDKPPAPFENNGLLVGQRWEHVLQSKLAGADLIVLVLSRNSVAKRGYVQVEFRTALNRMNYLPDSDVLVLPILTEECEVPSMTVGRINLTDLQWEIVPKIRLKKFASSLAQRILVASND